MLPVRWYLLGFCCKVLGCTTFQSCKRSNAWQAWQQMSFPMLTVIVFLWYYRRMAVIIFWPVVVGTHICIWGLLVLYKMKPYINVECSILCQNLSPSTYNSSFTWALRWASLVKVVLLRLLVGCHGDRDVGLGFKLENVRFCPRSSRVLLRQEVSL
jgi:hypothetical protein